MAHKNIVLAGFMGTGKSITGRLVAARLGWRFVDTDAVIVDQAGRSIAQIFADDGEAGFRQFEAAACRDAVAGCHCVIAVGGGALIDSAVRDMVTTQAVVINLRCDLDTIIGRVGHDPSRPLFSTERERLANLLVSRAAQYDSLPFQIDTTRLGPHAVAEEVIRLWQQNR
jgi:shikimate kinase